MQWTLQFCCLTITIAWHHSKGTFSPSDYFAFSSLFSIHQLDLAATRHRYEVFRTFCNSVLWQSRNTFTRCCKVRQRDRESTVIALLHNPLHRTAVLSQCGQVVCPSSCCCCSHISPSCEKLAEILTDNLDSATATNKVTGQNTADKKATDFVMGQHCIILLTSFVFAPCVPIKWNFCPQCHKKNVKKRTENWYWE